MAGATGNRLAGLPLWQRVALCALFAAAGLKTLAELGVAREFEVWPSSAGVANAAADTVSPASRSGLFTEGRYTPPPTAAPNVLSASFCQSCHQKGIFRQLHEYVTHHVRVPAAAVAGGAALSKISPPDAEDDADDMLLPVAIRPLPAQPAAAYRLMSHAATAAAYTVVAVCVFGPRKVYAAYSKMPDNRHPEWIARMHEARWQLAVGAYFLNNILSNLLSSSKAFEVYLGQKLVFSALEAKRLPTLEDFIQGLREAGAVFV